MSARTVYNKTIGFPHPPGVGGPGSFQARFEKVLKEHGWSVVYAYQDQQPDVILVVGGTKKLMWLGKMRRAGVPIIYRLDGIKWLHRKRRLELRNFLLDEYRNLNNKLISSFFSDYIVYQSEFVRNWWNRIGYRKSTYTIIKNGVDLGQFTPATSGNSCDRIVCLEGTLDYSPYAVKLLNDLADKVDLEIHIYGAFREKAAKNALSDKIKYHGSVSAEEVPAIMRNSIYLSLDVHPACPNTVIEALASGTPVLAFDTGSLAEIVTPHCGRVVPYGSDAWKLKYPNVDALATGAREIMAHYDAMCVQARQHAERYFDIQLIMNEYLNVINKLV